MRTPLQFRRPIGVIAFELGFDDLSYFNRAFGRRDNATCPRSGTALRRNKRWRVGIIAKNALASPVSFSHDISSRLNIIFSLARGRIV